MSLVYGDADYICNWLGGEALSLAADWPGAEDFRDAGYTELLVDRKAYGETRQFGKLSFTRVWEAGHEVPCKCFVFFFSFLGLRGWSSPCCCWERGVCADL